MFPTYWTQFAQAHDLIGASACLNETDDLSGVGADLEFLTDSEAAEELTEYWPGIGVAPDGYIPVAACAIGSGDYYYINRNDGPNGPLYRVYHDAVGSDGYNPDTAVVRVLDNYASVLSHLER